MNYHSGDIVRFVNDQRLGTLAGREGKIIRKIHPNDITITGCDRGSTCAYIVSVGFMMDIYVVLDGFIESYKSTIL